MIYFPSDAFIWLVIIVGIILLIVFPVRWLVKFIVRSARDVALNAKKKRFEKDLQEYLQDYKDGYLTEEELNEIIGDYNSRDSRISVGLTKRQLKDE